MTNATKRLQAILRCALGCMVLGAGLSAHAFVLGPTTPGKFGPPVFGTGASVTYSYMPTGTSCGAEGAGCTIAYLGAFMPAGFSLAIRAAFDAWSAVADLTFVEVPDDGSAFNAVAGSFGDIRLGGHAFSSVDPLGTPAHSFFPPVNGASGAGDIHFDTEELWKIGFGGPGFDIFQEAAQELGHALGLSIGVPGSLMYPVYSEAFSGPQADDIAGMQFIYGPAQTEVPVPVPATALLLGLGALGLGWSRRRKS